MLSTKKAVKKRKANDEQDIISYVFDTSILGTYAHKLAFKCALGDPSRPTPMKKKEANTGINIPKIVGAQFEVLEPLQIPSSNPLNDFDKNLMSYDPDNIKWEWHDKGEIVNLTPFECALLLVQPQFNGVCLGGNRPVKISYQKNKQEKEPVGTNTKLPRVVVQAYNSQTDTIKDKSMKPVLKVNVTVDEKTGRKTKERELLPGFEKWEPLVKKVKNKTKSTNIDPLKVPNEHAVKYYEVLGKTLPKEVLRPTDESYEDIMNRAKGIK